MTCGGDNHFKKSFCAESHFIPRRALTDGRRFAATPYAILDVTECNSQVDALKHISEVACDLRNNHTPTNASETCPNQFQTGSSKPLESIL